MLPARFPEYQTEPSDSRQRLQFSLRALLLFVTGCAAVLGVVAWIGADQAQAALMVGGFCLLVLGNWMSRERIIACGGVLLMAGCVVAVVFALQQLITP